MQQSMKRKSMPKPMHTSASTIATTEADRSAIERWEDEGGTSLPGEARLLGGPLMHSAPMNQAQ
jgi:hypothetical protein